MLCAAFNSTSSWAGKLITMEGEQYVLEDYGPIDPYGLVEYDNKGNWTQ